MGRSNLSSGPKRAMSICSEVIPVPDNTFPDDINTPTAPPHISQHNPSRQSLTMTQQPPQQHPQTPPPQKHPPSTRPNPSAQIQPQENTTKNTCAVTRPQKRNNNLKISTVTPKPTNQTAKTASSAPRCRNPKSSPKITPNPCATNKINLALNLNHQIPAAPPQHPRPICPAPTRPTPQPRTGLATEVRKSFPASSSPSQARTGAFTPAAHMRGWARSACRVVGRGWAGIRRRRRDDWQRGLRRGRRVLGISDAFPLSKYNCSGKELSERKLLGGEWVFN